MKLRCPRCRQKLTVPDDYGGKAVRCPACNRTFSVPKVQAAVGSAAEPGLDLDDLARLESSGDVLSKKELAKSSAALETQKPRQESLRVCPHCRKEVQAQDPHAEVLCSHCWHPIPAMVKGAKPVAAAAIIARTDDGSTVFYGGLISCLSYPLPALGSLFAAVLVAVSAALLPVALITGLFRATERSSASPIPGLSQPSLAGVTMLLLTIFGGEVFFFFAVAVHLFVDVVRTTYAGTDRPPNLTWSPRQWGTSLLAYVVFVVYYALMTYLLASLTVDENVLDMLLKGHLSEVAASGGSGLLAGIVIISAAIPMSIIGIAISSVLDGLNPVNVVRSIARTHVHYAFLVLLLCLYGLMFGAAFAQILFDWFLPRFSKMVAGSSQGDVAQVALALLVWGVVMGVFFYGAYVLARLHGLFARTFHKDLTFAG
jgi:DNA-directed RNA polymerase subunit RPC12/RpoP